MVVTMTVDAPGAEIHYTLDGSVPTADSPKYEIPFSINRSQTVTAAAYRNGRQIGEIKSKRF
jgi:hexosaminidase